MRILQSEDRARVINAVRKLFANETYCPFYFEDEQARVLSGEEEAIYDWAGVNFLMGNLVEESKGSGTVLNPKKTYGVSDLLHNIRCCVFHSCSPRCAAFTLET